MKLGCDFHGVLDKEPKLFSELTKLFVDNGHEVHVITGEEDSEKLRQKLRDLRISYTHLFSISSYHKSIDTEITYDEKNTPWLDNEVWNVTKAWYCSKHQIDLHIDDSKIYGQFFKTPYLHFENNSNIESFKL